MTYFNLNRFYIFTYSQQDECMLKEPIHRMKKIMDNCMDHISGLSNQSFSHLDPKHAKTVATVQTF